mgnify:CR=1 FL=1
MHIGPRLAVCRDACVLALEVEALVRMRAAVAQRDVGALEGALQQAASADPTWIYCLLPK